MKVAGFAIVLTVFCSHELSAAQPRPYFHRTEQAPYTFENAIVRLHFDVARGNVYGKETVVVHPKHRLQSLPFHTSQIHYSAITVNGQTVVYTFNPARERMNVALRRPVLADARLRIEFHYWTRPLRGIYFVRPDKSYPDVVPEIWSQGEPTDNHRWFPTWDEPNGKTPSELILTVPRGWTVVANGYLRAHTHTRSADIWDWNSPAPKSTYLIAFAAGPLVRDHSTLGAMDVDSFVQPQFASLNARCFARTKDMIAYYQRIIGVPYPFEKYDRSLPNGSRSAVWKTPR